MSKKEKETYPSWPATSSSPWIQRSPGTRRLHTQARTEVRRVVANGKGKIGSKKHQHALTGQERSGGRGDPGQGGGREEEEEQEPAVHRHRPRVLPPPEASKNSLPPAATLRPGLLEGSGLEDAKLGSLSELGRRRWRWNAARLCAVWQA